MPEPSFILTQVIYLMGLVASGFATGMGLMWKSMIHKDKKILELSGQIVAAKDMHISDWKDISENLMPRLIELKQPMTYVAGLLEKIIPKLPTN